VLSTKNILVFVVKTGSIKFLKSYTIEQIDSVFLCDRTLIIYYKIGGRCIISFHLTIGFIDDKPVKNEAEAQDLKKETETFVQYALYFFILIWRIYFLLTNQILKAVKIRKLKHVKLDKIYESYFQDIFQMILKYEVDDLNICTKLYEEKNGKKQEKDLNNRKKTQVGKKARHFINPFDKNDISEEDKFFILFCTTPYETQLVSTNEKNERIVSYCRVIVKIQNNLVIVIEPLKDSITIFGINEIRNITINEGRFIILFHIIQARIKRKLIFFTNTNYEEDYKNFKPFLIHLIENKR